MTLAPGAWRKFVPAAALVALLIAGAAAARLMPQTLLADLQALLHLVRGLGVAGSLVFFGLQVLVALSGILPAALLGVAAGALYGPLTGFALAALSTLAGAWLAFVLARSVWRPAIARILRRRRRLQDFDGRVAREGWRLVMLLRVSPVMPFSLTSYALGLSSVSGRDYLLGTLACLPALFGYVMIGVLAGAGLDAHAAAGRPVRTLLLPAGLVATLVLTLRLGRMAAAVLRTAPAAVAREAAE